MVARLGPTVDQHGSSSVSEALGAIVGRVLGAPARLGPVRLVAIDGPAGSGKTTLAGALSDELVGRGAKAAVLHLDDLYDGWTGLEGSL